MSPRPRWIHHHAVLKHPYRRIVAATPDFHDLDGTRQWAALRDQVVADAAGGRKSLLDVMDRRASRRDEVLAALEEGRQTSLK